MITIVSKVTVEAIRGRDVCDFLLKCTDDDYQKWWPGTHLQFHTVRRASNDVGNLVYMDEYIGKRRLRLHGIVKHIRRGKAIVWQMRKWINLPVWLTLSLEDVENAVKITHVLTIGYDDWRRVLDPFLRPFLSRSFEDDLHEHVRIEFNRLRDMLQKVGHSENFLCQQSTI